MTKLETATHVCLIGLCCLAAGLLIEQRFFSPAEEENPAHDLIGREVKLPGANWQSAPLSVLLQISSKCRFCNESMPFYKQLTTAGQARKIPMIVASRDAVDVMRKHLDEQQVAVDRVLHSRLDEFRMGTPTVYVVDSKGMVKRVFIGKLDAAGEKQLLAIVEQGKI